MKFDEAFNRRDAAAIAALYTQDAVEEKQGISAFGFGFWSASHRGKVCNRVSIGCQISEEVVDVRAIGNDICTIREWTVLSKKGCAATIYVREGNDWKIRMDSIN